MVAEHAAVRHCVAVVREDEPGNKQLVGYVIPRDGQKVAPKELREFLRRKLPEYMVPSHFVFLDAFPLTSNGKVDRRALPVPEKFSSRQAIVLAAKFQRIEAGGRFGQNCWESTPSA